MLQLSPTEEFVRGKWVESCNMKTRSPRPGCGVGVASSLTRICALRGQKVAKIHSELLLTALNPTTTAAPRCSGILTGTLAAHECLLRRCWGSHRVDLDFVSDTAFVYQAYWLWLKLHVNLGQLGSGSEEDYRRLRNPQPPLISIY